MGFNNVYLTQVGFIMNLVYGSKSLQFHIISDDILYTVVSSTAVYPEVRISLSIQRNSRIWSVLDQEDDTQLDGKYLIAY